jgi:hypothetical protein
MSALSKLFEAMSAVMLRETGRFEVNEGTAAPETKPAQAARAPKISRGPSTGRKSVSGHPLCAGASQEDRSRRADSVMIGLMK